MSPLLYCQFVLFMMLLLNQNNSSANTIESTTESIFQKAVDELLELQNNFTRDQNELKTERQEFDQKLKQMQQSAENTDVIRLNVGGQLIMTIRETLTRVPKSNLAIMFNGRWQHKLPIDQEGNIFFDFNPILFRHLLDQLQTLEKNNPTIIHPPIIPTLVKPFNKMLEKLGLNPPSSSEDGVVTFNVGGHTVTNRHNTLTRLSNINFTTSVAAFKPTKSDNISSVFLDYNPKLFQHLIDHLRENSSKNSCLLKTPSYTDNKAFNRMLGDLGVDAPVCLPKIAANARWIQNGVTVAGGNGKGKGLNQLHEPYGVYVNDDQTFYVVDKYNHRIMEWKNGATTGRVVAGGNGSGNRNDQLSGPVDVIVDKNSDSLIISDSGNKRVMRWPRRNGINGEIIISNVDCYGLTMDNDGYLYVSDGSKHEVTRWKIGDISEIVVAGGNGAGNRLDQLNSPANIFIDQNHSVYVSDLFNHRVVKWMKGAKEGILVTGVRGKTNDGTQVSNPRGIVVDQLGTVYVPDCNNDRIIRWPKEATQGSIIAGGNGEGPQANQFSCPFGLSFDRQGNLYVSDRHNHRVQKFNINSSSNT